MKHGHTRRLGTEDRGTVKIRMNSVVARFLIAMAVALASFAGRAQAANSIPKNWSFEEFKHETPIVTTNGVGSYGWEGKALPFTNTAPARVIRQEYPAPSSGYPLPLSTHSNVLAVFGEASNRFDRIGGDLQPWVGYSNVWVDLTMQAGRRDTEPDVPNGTQVALYFNTNGQMVVRHAHYLANFDVFRRWTVLDTPPVATDAWVRITIKIDYLSSGNNPVFPDLQFSEHYYQIRMNGGAFLSAANAYASPIETEPVPTGGTYFLCADSGFTQPDNRYPNNMYFSGIAMSGQGAMDDVVIGTAEPSAGSLSPFDRWMQSHGLTDPTRDEEPDGANNYAEWLAGTDPWDPLSKFQIKIQGTNTSGRWLTWEGRPQDGVSTKFWLYRTTNLMDGNAWVRIATNIVRSPTGSNTWVDPSPPKYPVFYRPALPNATNSPY